MINYYRKIESIGLEKIEFEINLEKFKNFSLGKKTLNVVNGGTQLIVFEDYDGDGRDDTPE